MKSDFSQFFIDWSLNYVTVYFALNSLTGGAHILLENGVQKYHICYSRFDLQILNNSHI